MHSQIKKFSSSKKNSHAELHARTTNAFFVKIFNLPGSRRNNYLTRVGKLEHFLKKITLYESIE